MSYNPSGPGYTPPGGPGYSPVPTGPAAPMMSQAGVQDVINSWISSLTKPAVGTYAAEVPRTSTNRIIISVALATVVAAVLGAIGGIFSGGHIIGGLIYSLITTPLFFFAAVGAMYAVARI